MFFLKEVGQRMFPDFNKRVHNDDDGYEYCEKRNLYIHETALTDDLGEYLYHKYRPVIVLHKYLDRKNFTWVFLHEIGHDGLHSPLACKFSVDLRRRIEKEANIIASILMLPKEIVWYCSDTEIISEFNYPRKLIQMRRKFLNDYNE